MSGFRLQAEGLASAYSISVKNAVRDSSRPASFTHDPELVGTDGQR